MAISLPLQRSCDLAELRIWPESRINSSLGDFRRVISRAAAGFETSLPCADYATRCRFHSWNAAQIFMQPIPRDLRPPIIASSTFRRGTSMNLTLPSLMLFTTLTLSSTARRPNHGTGSDTARRFPSGRSRKRLYHPQSPPPPATTDRPVSWKLLIPT